MAADDVVNILLVDDEPNNLLALETILVSPDRRLVRASSGREALRRLLQDDFAVILLDVRMPDLDGFETAELIRGRERTSDTPIIFLTAAQTGEPAVARGYSIGAVDYITKPIDPAVLRSKVAVFVELFRKTQQIKRQARELADTTALLNSVLDGATEYAITATDLKGRFLLWNEGARRLYGYTAEEVVGKRDIELLHTREDIESGRVAELFKTAARTGKAEGEFERVRKNGRRFIASVIVSRRKDASGATVGFASISRDITALKRAERERAELIEAQAARAAAEAARDRLQQVVDVLPVGLAIADAEGRIYLSNAAARNIIGQTPVETSLGPDDPHQVLLLDGSPCPPAERPLSRAVFRGEVVRDEQLLICNFATGRRIPVLVNAAPLSGPAGEIVGGVVAFLDITTLKELEQQKDAFLGAISHDLRNPLTAIKARAQLLQRRAEQLSGEAAASIAEGLGAIDLAATRITGMINELLDVTRIQAGQPLDLDRQSMDLVELAGRVSAELQPGAERHRIEVVSELPALVGTWDAARLERALTNLVSNAIKYSPAGGQVRVELGQECDNGDEWAVLRVADRGVGIPGHELPRVFERFFRGSNVQGKFAGTGLGLAGARQIVEQHGGQVSVESQEQAGTTFTIRLPLAQRPTR